MGCTIAKPCYRRVRRTANNPRVIVGIHPWPHSPRITCSAMRLLWNFTGNSARYASRVQGLQAESFQVGFDGAVALPARGDLLNLIVTGVSEPARFVCTGRRFDLAASGGPVLRIDLELAPTSHPGPGANHAVESPPHHSLASVR